MSVEQIKTAIEQLSFEERVELAAWLHGCQDDEWDEQIKRDVAAGKFDHILREVDEDIPVRPGGHGISRRRPARASVFTGKRVTRRLCSGMLGTFVHKMPNSEFWKKTNAAAAKAVRSAKGKHDSTLRRDWKLKQASRSGSHSYVSILEVRTLGTGLTRAVARQLA